MSETRIAGLKYDENLEEALASIEGLLEGNYGSSKRSIGLFLLQGDPDIEKRVREKDSPNYQAIQEIVARARSGYSQPLSYIIALRRQQAVKQILDSAVTFTPKSGSRFGEKLSRAMMNSITGFPILLIVLYFGLYRCALARRLTGTLVVVAQGGLS